jgi:CARDB
MRRVVPLLLAVLAVAAPAGASAATPLRASLTSCSALTRTAVFSGSMPTVRGTRTMAMRFDLQSRADADADWERVAVPGLGVYKRSGTGQTGFVFTQRVQELDAPGMFRAVVRFRWYARGGATLKTASRTTGTCVQPDPRPDLRAGVLAGTLQPDGATMRYALAVHNAGVSGAGPFAVEIAGVRAAVGALAPGAETTVTVDAPPCTPGQTVSVVLDPAGQVDEADESDDGVQRACPLS